MVTGDNPLTAATVAAEAGVDDCSPRRHRRPSSRLVRGEQARGAARGRVRRRHERRAGACSGRSGHCPEPRLRPQRARLGNMIDLDSDPMKLIQVIPNGQAPGRGTSHPDRPRPGERRREVRSAGVPGLPRRFRAGLVPLASLATIYCRPRCWRATCSVFSWRCRCLSSGHGLCRSAGHRPTGREPANPWPRCGVWHGGHSECADWHRIAAAGRLSRLWGWSDWKAPHLRA